jgi:hypothetical protein
MDAGLLRNVETRIRTYPFLEHYGFEAREGL